MTSKPEGIEARYVLQMNHLAKTIDEVFRKREGFCLLVFPFAELDGRVRYISNADRASMLSAMKQFIARAEGRLPEGESLQ